MFYVIEYSADVPAGRLYGTYESQEDANEDILQDSPCTYHILDEEQYQTYTEWYATHVTR